MKFTKIITICSVKLVLGGDFYTRFTR